MSYTPIFLEHFEKELEELLDFPNMGSVYEGVYLFNGYRKLK